MPPSPSRVHDRSYMPRAATIAVGWLAAAVAVAVVTFAIVVAYTRPTALRIGLDRVSGMSWIAMYAGIAAVSGLLALALLRVPRKITVVLAAALVAQFVFVEWMRSHGGA